MVFKVGYNKVTTSFNSMNCKTTNIARIKLISTKSNIINILLSDVNAKESGLDGAAYEFSGNIDNVKLNVQVSDYQGNEIANALLYILLEFPFKLAA